MLIFLVTSVFLQSPEQTNRCEYELELGWNQVGARQLAPVGHRGRLRTQILRLPPNLPLQALSYVASLARGQGKGLLIPVMRSGTSLQDSALNGSLCSHPLFAMMNALLF